MFKIKSLVKSGRNGVKEITTGEMTVGERRVLGVGVGVGSGAALAMFVGGKVVLGVSVVVGGLALGRAFTRGFIDQMKTELRTNQ